MSLNCWSFLLRPTIRELERLSLSSLGGFDRYYSCSMNTQRSLQFSSSTDHNMFTMHANIIAKRRNSPRSISERKLRGWKLKFISNLLDFWFVLIIRENLIPFSDGSGWHCSLPRMCHNLLGGWIAAAHISLIPDRCLSCFPRSKYVKKAQFLKIGGNVSELSQIVVVNFAKRCLSWIDGSKVNRYFPPKSSLPPFSIRFQFLSRSFPLPKARLKTPADPRWRLW